mgnify:CR=1 FL=1
MTELETNITKSLQKFADENPLYFKPTTLDEWESTWDFGEFDANIYNHGLHQYPARLIPQLVRKIVRTFADENANVLDIFSGSGTTLLECKYLGIKNAYGIELNPFAVFMTKAKLQDVEENAVTSALNEIQKSFFDETYAFPLVSFKNIEFWYSENARRDLSKLFDIISKLADEKAKRFYLLAFCEISRKTSFLDHGGFKMYRSRTKIKNHFEPDVWAEFYRTAQRNIELLKNHNAILRGNGTKQTLVLGDSRVVHSEIPAHSIDLILTSPPYGDSKTTVAYGQYSRLPWQWLSQKDDIIQLDGNLLGGSTKNLDRSVLDLSAKLKEQAEEIEKADDSKRVNDVIAFYNDLYATLTSATHYMKQDGYFILVTGNRTVKKVYLRTDIIITEFARMLGYTTEKVYSRNIINKRMASKNSPTNEKGKTVNTMMTENIIVLKKD